MARFENMSCVRIQSRCVCAAAAEKSPAGRVQEVEWMDQCCDEDEDTKGR